MSVNTIPHIHALLKPETIRVGMPGGTKREVIDAVVDLIAEHPSVRDVEAVRAAVLEREKVMSTGVGKGLGLPHAKTPAVRSTVAALAITDTPVDFGAIDNEPVRLIFLLVGTEAARSQHIKILSRISRLLNRDPFRQRLLKATSAEEVQKAFADVESELVGG
ncbi:MAG TPA: PTS sugar transporter subunit IIA [Rhodothermales bacterium]|nr:PTS sugar transporter subunit IIA [Rhodothermales bacterium]